MWLFSNVIWLCSVSLGDGLCGMCFGYGDKLNPTGQLLAQTHYFGCNTHNHSMISTLKVTNLFNYLCKNSAFLVSL